jgi:lipoprotein-releasing system permease protein
MSYESFVGLRYLMAKKRSSVVSIITIISITGVALGVMAMIVVLSVMGGFKKDLKEKILGTKAHIVIQHPEEKSLPDALSVADRVATIEGVVGASPFLESEVMISSPAGLSGVVLRGIVTDRIGQVSELPDDIIKGKLEYLEDHEELTKNLAAERERDFDELLARTKRVREELAAEREKNKEKSGDGKDGAGNIAVKKPSSIHEDGKLPDPPNIDELLDPDAINLPVTDEDILGISPQFKGIANAPPRDEDAKEKLPVIESAEPLEEAFDIPDLPDEMPSLVAADPLDEASDIPDLPDEMPSLDGQDTSSDKPSKKDGPRAVPGLIIGPELAKSLQVSIGEEVNVVTPNGDLGPMGRMPRSRPFRIVGIFYSGMYEYDANFAYTTLDDAMDFVAKDGATGIELKTENVDRAVEIAARVQTELGSGFDVLDWKELNRSLFYALKLEKIAMFVVLTFIILVASFSIIAMLIMIVIEKGREIAVLKSLGATDGGVMRTFIFQGTVIGTVGATIGLAGGLVICFLLEKVGFPLDPDVYYISTLPIDINIEEIVSVVVCAILISILATIYPSIQAARLKPVDGLRDD